MRSNSRPIVRAGALALLLLGGAAILAVAARGSLHIQPRVATDARQTEPMKAGAFKPAHSAPAFTLPGTDGTELTLERYRGKVVLLTFGFTYCAAVCPTTLSTLAQAKASLGQAGDSVQVIFITVDPERDDVGQLGDYLAAFDPGFIGAAGTPEALAKVRGDYGVTAVRQGSGPDYAMAHTSSIFLIDPAGKLRGLMPFGRDASDFAHDIKYLLTNGGPV